MQIEQTQKAVYDVIAKCAEQEAEGGSKFPGMTYEQGVQAGIDWLLGNADSNPLE